MARTGKMSAPMLDTRHPKKYFVAGVYKLLTDTGITQGELAERVGKYGRQLNTWMRKPDSPELDMGVQLAICQYFGMQYMEIVDYGRSILDEESIKQRVTITDPQAEIELNMTPTLLHILDKLSKIEMQVSTCMEELKSLKKEIPNQEPGRRFGKT